MLLLEEGGVQTGLAKTSSCLSHFPLKNHHLSSSSILHLLWAEVFFDLSYICH